MRVKKRAILSILFLLVIYFILDTNQASAKTITVEPKDFLKHFTPTRDAIWNEDAKKITLTKNVGGQVGGFYLNDRISTKGSFILKGKIYLGNKTDGNGGGDGMSFIFHPNAQTSMGDSGGSLGMLGISNVRGFRLDTYYNPDGNADGLPDDWPFLSRYREGHANTPFGGLVTTDQDGQLIYDYGSNKPLNTSKFLTSGVVAQDITVSYDKDNKTLTVNLDGQSWVQDKIDSDDSLAFQVQASTGMNYNEQYFIFDSFTFDEARKITVKEVWNHGDNAPENYPSGGYILTANGDDSSEKVTDPGSTVITDLDNLEELDNEGNEIKYGIKQKEVPHYITEEPVYDPATDTYTITRTYNPNETNIKVNESWDDNNDSYGLRPEKSSFQMKANDTTLDEIYQNSADKDWAQEITLPERDKDGEGDPIKYSVVVPDDIPDYETNVVDNEDGSFTITHTLKRVIKLMSVPELLKWTGRTIPMPNKVLNRDAENDMTVTVMDTTSNQANWDVTAKLENTNQSSKLYSLIWKENANVSDAEAKDLVGQKVLTNQSTKPNANQTYLYEKTWGADAGILLKTKDYVPIGEYKDLTIHWTLENVAGNE